ncbi:MAG: hypothetical protein IT381_27170 [Deltaproteobacteria bacterium]|nr:hypothetical protein [Deltaproteobacteria bacterium]
MIAHWLGLFAFGALAGSLLDGIHTHSGMTVYATPWWWMMAVWTPPLFGFAAVAIAFAHWLSDRKWPRPAPVPSWTAVGVGGAIFAITYYLSGYLPAGNVVKALVLIAIFVGCWLAYDRTRHGLVLATITAAGGASAEITLTTIGAFRHLHPDVAYLPYWLPCLYLVASVTVGNVGRRFV